MSPAPNPADPLALRGAIAAPAPLRHFGAPTRRAVLVGGLSAALCPLRGGAAPEAALRGRVGEPIHAALVDASITCAFWGLYGAGGFPGLSQATPSSSEARGRIFTPREAGFGFYGAYRANDIAPPGALVVEEPAPPMVDVDFVAVISGGPPFLRVNGEAAPLTLDARPGARLRLRFASVASEMRAIVASQPVQIVAIDGQPCETFTPRDGAMPLCPSARIEVIFDLGDAPAEFSAEGSPLLRIVPSGPRGAALAPLAPLPANPRLPTRIALEKAVRATAVVSGDYKINGIGGGVWPHKPLFEAKRGQPVVLTLINKTPAAQTLRLEGHWARVLHSLDDGWDPYWRDALYLEAGRTLHVAFVADAPGVWPLASPSPDERAKGLSTWFQVA